MKRFSKLLSGVAVAAAMSTAQAAPINVGGVVWDPNSIFDFTTGDAMVETIVGAVGDVLNGYARITSVNGTAPGTFCPGCELTYTFTGYTVSSVDVILGATFLTFSGGTISVFVDSTPNFDPLLQSTAGDGVLFLTLAGHPGLRVLTGNTGTLHSGATPTLPGVNGNGSGYLDVAGGLAAPYFDTDTQFVLQTGPSFDTADFQFTSSFQLLPGAATFVSDDGKTYGLFGTNDLQGASTVPEPGTLFLLGLGLLGFAAIGRRAQLKA